MKKILNTLYIFSQNKYLALDGENIVIKEEGKIVARLPLHNLQAIVTAGYNGVSPGLLGKCAEKQIDVVFLSYSGRFMARLVGKRYGNVFLRRKQYRVADNHYESLEIAKNFIIGKIYNERWVMERGKRDYPLRIDVERIENISENLKNSLEVIEFCENMESLRGIEGEAASTYFSGLDLLILNQKNDFKFIRRNKRPPMDSVNAMLSFAYTLLANDCASALEAVGLDPYVGFMHVDRSGRPSLALDLMEELRSVVADRFVISLINKNMVKSKDFQKKENGAVLMGDKCRSEFIKAWQKSKTVEIKHPYLKEKVQWGMVPYVQALLLARLLRGDLDGYPPFLWK